MSSPYRIRVFTKGSVIGRLALCVLLMLKCCRTLNRWVSRDGGWPPCSCVYVFFFSHILSGNTIIVGSTTDEKSFWMLESVHILFLSSSLNWYCFLELLRGLIILQFYLIPTHNVCCIIGKCYWKHLCPPVVI